MCVESERFVVLVRVWEKFSADFVIGSRLIEVGRSFRGIDKRASNAARTISALVFLTCSQILRAASLST